MEEATPVGALATVAMLPDPEGQSLEHLTEEHDQPVPSSATVLALAQSRDIRPPPA